MRCADAIDRIARSLERELPADLERELESHLASCARCRAERDLQAALREALAEPPAVRLSGDFTARVVEAALRAEPTGARSRAWPGLAGVLALAAAAAGVRLLAPDAARLLGAGAGEEWGRRLASPVLPIRAGAEEIGWAFAELARSMENACDGYCSLFLIVAVVGLTLLWGAREALSFLRD